MADAATGHPSYEIIDTYMLGVRLVKNFRPLCQKEICGCNASTVYKAWEIFRQHSIDVFVSKSKSLTLHIRDDCTLFDPMEWLRIHQNDNKIKNIGIRTICSLATEVRYSRTLGLNYLFLR